MPKLCSWWLKHDFSQAINACTLEGNTLKQRSMNTRFELMSRSHIKNFQTCSMRTARHISWAALWILSATLSSLAAEATNQPARAACSVHLGYPAPDAALFYNELVVEQSTGGSYFMACGWNTGYFGIQELADHRKVILFSVWDPTKGNDPQAVKTEERVECLYQAPDVRIKRFGGEGTGGQCMGAFPWESGETNRFALTSKVEDKKTAYSGYVWLRSEQKWKQLVTFRTRTGGLPLRGLYSFVEDFRRDTKSVHDVRRARFGNAWIKTVGGEWLPLEKARFTASNATWESKENIDAGREGMWYFLATGGQTRSPTPLRSVIQLDALKAKPPQLELPTAELPH